MTAMKRRVATKKNAPGSQPVRTRDENTITIVGRNDTSFGQDDEFLSDDIIKISDYLYERKVEISTVRGNLKKFLTQIGDIVGDAPRAFGKYELHEIEISAELSLSGELKIWGVGGADVEGKAGIKFLIRHSSGSTNT